MAFKRITENDMLGKGNVGKPDTPGVSTSEMQRIMDELPREVIAPAFNELSGQLEANTASADIGANAPDGITPDPAPAENSPAKLQSVLQGIVNKITDHIADQVKHVKSEERTLWNNASNDRHTHDNKSILDGITSSLVGNWNAAFAHISDAVRHITENERTNWNDKYTKSETDKAINERVVEIGSSDMTKAVYDPETRNLPYIPKIDAEALTLGKNVVLSGTPVSIAYAGAQRIASITAYGENAQGGTTEAPVALTGVDSVQVCGTNLFINNVTEGITNNGVTFTLNSDKSITVDGTNTSSTAPAAIYTGHNSNLPSGTYTLSSASSLTYGVDVKIKIKRASGNFIWIVINSSSNSQTFNIKTGDIIVDFYVVVIAGQTADNVKVYPMLNVGSTALPYEPYNGSITQLPIPRALHKVGDVRDVCRTRVKSKWDKSLQVESSELKKNNANAYQYYVNTDTRNVNKNVEPGCNRFVPSYSAGISAFEGGFNFWMKEVLEVDDLEHAKAWFDEHPTKVFYQSTAYDGTNGLDVCLTEYQNDFVELDGTEASHIFEGMFYLDYSAAWPTPANRVNGVCSHYPYGAYGKGKIGLTDNGAAVVYNPNGDYTGDEGGLANWKAYLAAQKEAGTPVQVAYQLAAPEVYATDPVDFDNTAGPLTVMTGGEVEVRMTELVGSRSPELTHKLDKTGDGSNVTAAFTEAEQDADIQTGEELTVLFGKIKKRFSVVNKLVNGAVYPNLLDNSDFTNLVNQRGEAVYDYLTGIGYGPDRWQLVEAKYTLASQTVTSAGSSHTYGSQLRQIIPLEKIKIGDTVTASISTESGILNGTAKLELKIDTSVSDLPYVIEQDWGGVKIGCIKENVCHVIVFLKENKSVKINWVKLEKGGVATPYVPKGYGAELAECLRYFQRVHADWRIYPTLKDMLYRFSQSTLQVMRIKPTISAHGTPYTFGCTINALDAQPMAFTVETKITEQGQNAAAASMLGYFDLSADL